MTALLVDWTLEKIDMGFQRKGMPTTVEPLSKDLPDFLEYIVGGEALQYEICDPQGLSLSFDARWKIFHEHAKATEHHFAQVA